MVEDDGAESHLSPWLYFEVEDTGMGIPPEIQDKVLEPFVRGTTGRGTGLGLSIANKLVELMGGRIEILSPVNQAQGTLVRFYFPLILPEPHETPQIEEIKQIIGLASGQPTYRLLVVEEQSDQRQLLTTLLTDVGFQVQEISSGKEVLEIWFDWRPHLILINTQMLLIDTYESLKQIKQLTHTHGTIIIGLRDYQVESPETEHLTAVCDEILPKPCDLDLLFHKIANYLKVDYQYEIVKSPAQVQNILRTSLQASSLQVMSPEWIREVYQASSEGHSQELYRLIEKIPQENSSLILSMTELVNHFNFRQIRKLSSNNHE